MHAGSLVFQSGFVVGVPVMAAVYRLITVLCGEERQHCRNCSTHCQLSAAIFFYKYINIKHSSWPQLTFRMSFWEAIITLKIYRLAKGKIVVFFYICFTSLFDSAFEKKKNTNIIMLSFRLSCYRSNLAVPFISPLLRLLTLLFCLPFLYFVLLGTLIPDL